MRIVMRPATQTGDHGDDPDQRPPADRGDPQPVRDALDDDRGPLAGRPGEPVLDDAAERELFRERDRGRAEEHQRARRRSPSCPPAGPGMLSRAGSTRRPSPAIANPPEARGSALRTARRAGRRSPTLARRVRRRTARAVNAAEDDDRLDDGPGDPGRAGRIAGRSYVGWDDARDPPDGGERRRRDHRGPRPGDRCVAAERRRPHPPARMSVATAATGGIAIAASSRRTGAAARAIVGGPEAAGRGHGPSLPIQPGVVRSTAGANPAGDSKTPEGTSAPLSVQSLSKQRAGP